VTIALRPATAADQPAIEALIAELHLYAGNIRWPQFVVATDDAAPGIVAMGQIRPQPDGTEELGSIGTAPAYRGRGLAHQIIAHLIAAHPGTLYLMCLHPMGPLYEQFGFRTVAVAELPPHWAALLERAGQAHAEAPDEPPLQIMRRDGSTS
jgi:GNAT superfamily N-acetyltransferase